MSGAGWRRLGGSLQRLSFGVKSARDGLEPPARRGLPARTIRICDWIAYWCKIRHAFFRATARPPIRNTRSPA